MGLPSVLVLLRIWTKWKGDSLEILEPQNKSGEN